MLPVLLETTDQGFNLIQLFVQQADVGLQPGQLRGLCLDIAGEGRQRLPVGLPILLEGGDRRDDGA